MTPLQQLTVHVIARSLDTYEEAEQFLTIFLTDDRACPRVDNERVSSQVAVRFNTTLSQLVELRVRNVEAEDLIGRRGEQLKRLERAVHETFRGRVVNPYIFNVLAEYEPEASANALTAYRAPIKSG